MLQDLRFQLSTAILTVLTIAAAVAAGFNYQQQQIFRLPDDGVIWRVQHGQVVATHVIPKGAGYLAGIRAGDVLVSIQGVPVYTTQDVAKLQASPGAWSQETYGYKRNGVPVNAVVILREATRRVALTYQYLVGVCYLVIGLFIFFRRGNAYKARHFYIFCLVSFIFCSFHSTLKLNPFDQVVDYANFIAGWLAPLLFLHFCMTFPENRPWYRTWMPLAMYVPGVVLTSVYAGFATGVFPSSPNSLPDVLDAINRAWMGLLTAAYVSSGIVLQIGYRHSEDPVIRQQLKWLRNGMLFGFAPFGTLYALPFVLDVQFSPYLNYAVVTLPLIPLTIAWAIVRYRLMDVDVIFRRGFAYTLATLVMLTAFYGVVFKVGSMVQKPLGNTGVIIVMLIATYIFQPLRNWIQEKLDRHFYRDHYNYRHTLEEFARELNSETDLDRMLQSVADRLMQTLSIRHVAFLFGDGEPDCGGAAGAQRWRLRMSMGSPARPLTSPEALDLSFLDWPQHSPYLFFERTRYHLDAVASSWPASVRQTIADLDLNYYVPCSVRGRTIAFLGVSRTETGEFLSSDDVELLLTLANYVGIAIENTCLYRSLKAKVGEYERLKEFSENILESINVGVLAADLADRVESWNTQMERLSGIGREDAVGRFLSELFPASLIEQLERTRGEMRIHHLDKFTLEASRLDRGRGEATLNIAIAPLVSREMEQIGRLVIFDDITERAELESRLVQADKLSSIGLLAAGVAHEVNTPLAVISTYAQMLSKQVVGDEQKSRMLEKISRQSFRASEIVNSLLNFSRTSSTELVEVQLNRVVHETLSLLEHQLRKASIEVRVNLEPDLEPVKGNAGKLQQVFLNLFLNARDAMEAAPPRATGEGHRILEIVTRRGENGVEVDVLDTGSGIAPEHLSRIYDPFFTTKGSRKGTGLGLSVTYGIIQEHGGAIEASSRPGQGTCFHLEFPAITRVVHA